MKRQIICKKCNKKHPRLFATGAPYPGEHIKNVKGRAIRRYRCDFCNKEIEEGVKCHAVSFWAEHGRHRYYEWEQEFITV